MKRDINEDLKLLTDVFGDRKLITIYKAAELLGCHWQTIRNYIKQGKLNSKTFLNKVYVYEHEVLSLKPNF